MAEFSEEAATRRTKVDAWTPDADTRMANRRRLEQLYTPIGQKPPTEQAADAELGMWDRDAKATRGDLSEAERRQRVEAGRASAAKRAGAGSSHWWRTPRGRAAIGVASFVGAGLAGYGAARITEGIARRRHEQQTRTG